MMSRRPSAPLGILLLSLAIAGCYDCTLIGCEGALTVHLSAKPASAFRVEVISTAPADGKVYAVDCPDVSRCSQDVGFRSVYVTAADIRVIVGSDTLITKIPNIAYTKSEPNGSRCGPTCWYATVTAEAPKS